jgi:divalent metal cation (Fe/Co/Zn/Cd) transporter
MTLLALSLFYSLPPYFVARQVGDVVSFLAIRVARRPPNSSHPFGHGKYEPLGAFGIAGLLMFTAVETAKSSILALISVVAAVCQM